MEPFRHTMNDLYQQLGVGTQEAAIAAFIQSHQLAKTSKPVQYADCFTQHQQAFMQQAYEQDADWVALIEQLDVLLRKGS